MSHVLGVVIAFVTLMLLLSMVVTGIVQATQGLLRIRSKNLLVAVANVLEKHWGPNFDTRKEALEAAAEVLNADNVAIVDKVKNPDTVLRRRLLGPRVSWAPPKELAAAAVTHMDHHTDSRDQRGRPHVKRPGTRNTDNAGRTMRTAETVQHDFQQLEPALKKRFNRFIRTWTVIYSFIVAALFQVSTPALLASFSNGTRSTEPYTSQLDSILNRFNPADAETRNDVIADAVLQQLTERYPQHRDDLDEAGLEETTKEGLQDEVRNVLYEAPDREQVAQAAGEIFDQVTQPRPNATTAEAQAAGAVEQLDAFGIKFLGDKYFYRNEQGKWQIGAFFGVLLTGILLSFGAPFWYEQLRNLAALRDVRAPEEKKPKRRKVTVTETGDTDSSATDSSTTTTS